MASAEILEIMAEAAKRRARAIALAAEREVYSVEVAKELGIGVSNALAMLRDLENRGLLLSRFVPPSECGDRGPGRRYFRAAGAP